MKCKAILIPAITFLLFSISCKQTATLHRFDDKKRISVFQLSDTSLMAVKNYLAAFSTKKIQDTIIIMYDYNHETCWNFIDQNETDEQLKQRVNYIQINQQQIAASRPGISFFEFREPGNDINKIKKYDTSIIIDHNLELYHFFFKERCVCGNSIVILPDGRYIFTRSDSHKEALYYSSEQISELLKIK
ncbi:MAG: hypothetical protein WCH52_00620 [Bacteroidota bacterium]